MNSRALPGFRSFTTGIAAIAGALSLFATLSGCQATPSPGPATHNVPGYVALERTSGTLREAPAYVVTLYQDGGVLFEGRANVRSKGTFSKHISPERAAAVFARLDAVDFWNREPRYDVDRATKATGESLILRSASPDAPWDVISARYHNRFKRIDGLFFAPRELTDLKTLIEDTVGLADWVNGTGAEKPE